MDIFNLTLKQMLLMFCLILAGFVVRKKKLLPDNAGTSMAKLETYIFVPALSLFNQITKCTVESFCENWVLMLYGLGIVICAILLSYPLSLLFVPKADDSDKKYQRNIYKYALTFGNYGFMGNFIILGVWGTDMFYKYSLFTFLMSIFCYGWGLFILIPKDENSSSFADVRKRLLNPPLIALILGMAIGLLDLTGYIPAFAIDALESAGACQGPVAMVLAGFVIGGYDIKGLISDKKVYIVSIFRLIIIPALLMFVLRALGTSETVMILAMIAYATPLGLNTIVYPAAYGGDTGTGASMTMISHTLSVITIPLMYLIFVVLL